jgi:hypothetical protein
VRFFDVTGGADRCPTELELSRAISLGPTPAIGAHLASCGHCARRSHELALPRELARAVASAGPCRATLEQTRTALLASFASKQMPAPRMTSPWLLVTSLAMSAALSAFFLIHRSPSGGGQHPRVLAHDPMVQAPGLGSSANEPTSLPEPRVAAPVRTASIRRRLAADRRIDREEPSPAEREFVAGWNAFRSDSFQAAIGAFSEVLRLDSTGSLAEDATYWRAVSRLRMGDRGGTEELHDFVSRYPRSGHVGDANRLLDPDRAQP